MEELTVAEVKLAWMSAPPLSLPPLPLALMFLAPHFHVSQPLEGMITCPPWLSTQQFVQ